MFYGNRFETFPASPYPSKAQTFKSLKEVKEKYEEFLADCQRFGYEPLDYWLYEGKPDGDEEQYGYPDYPDYIIKQERYVCKVERV